MNSGLDRTLLFRPVASLIALGLLLGVAADSSAEWHRQRACLRCGLPCRPYGADGPFAGATVDSLPAVSGTVALVPQDKSVAAQSKSFKLSAPFVAVDHVRMDQAAVTVYDNGELSASGLLTHSGGPEGSLQGNYVTVRVRIYGSSTVTEIAPPDGPLFFESSRTIWLQRARPTTIRLDAPAGNNQIRNHFGEIQRIAINLEYRKSR